MEELSGGRESAIYRDGEVVYRPLQSWSSTIHLILKHFERAKIAETPKFLGVNKDQEILSFVAGNTYNYPLVGAIATKKHSFPRANYYEKYMTQQFHSWSNLMSMHTDGC